MDDLERMIRDGETTVRPAAEICTALLERIARSPLDQFNQLKTIYFDHCVNGAAQTG